jgi:hypothetical protein
MSPIQILKLVGSPPAQHYLYIAWLIWNRKLGLAQKLIQPVQLITILQPLV